MNIVYYCVRYDIIKRVNVKTSGPHSRDIYGDNHVERYKRKHVLYILFFLSFFRFLIVHLSLIYVLSFLDNFR